MKKHPTKCSTKFCRGLRGIKGGDKCSKCKMRAWRLANPVKAVLARLRCRAQRKRIPFDLDEPWLAKFMKDYDNSLHHIDRISAFGGYTKNNLQILTISDNIAKGNRERHGQAHWC